MRKTFGDILEQNRGAGPGFDLLRLALALAILLSHLAAIGGTRGILPSIVNLFYPVFDPSSSGVIDAVNAATIPGTGVPQAPQGLSRPIVLTHVPMFFAVSGFLVAGSAFRTKKIIPFLGLRLLRIFPALCVEVVLSALLIGMLLTDLPLREYFSNPLFWTYFGNIVGFVQMELPGVMFRGSHAGSAVNANLWTLPAEFYCYLILSALIGIGLVFNRTVSTGCFVAVTAGLLIANIFYDYNASTDLPPGSVNVYYFFCGLLFFIWRDRIPHTIWLLIPCAIATYFLMKWKHGVYITPLILTYVTVFIGLTKFPRFRLIESGDYSYGIYLYGFPISQLLVTTFPALRGNYFALMWPALICTCIFAALSWHLIEKRVLRLRKYLNIQSAKIAETLHPQQMN